MNQSLKSLGANKKKFGGTYENNTSAMAFGNCNCNGLISESCEDSFTLVLTAAQKLLPVTGLLVEIDSVDTIVKVENPFLPTFDGYWELAKAMNKGGMERNTRNHLAYNATTSELTYQHVGEKTVKALILSDGTQLATTARKCNEVLYCSQMMFAPSISGSLVVNGTATTLTPKTWAAASAVTDATAIQTEITTAITAALPSGMSAVTVKSDVGTEQFFIKISTIGIPQLSLNQISFTRGGCEPRFV